jgi:glycosyltransferase involved in cell wall biosynthesis
MQLLDGVIFVADGGDDARFDDLRLARDVGVPSYIIPNSLADEKPATPRGERDQIVAVGSYTQAKGFDFVLSAYAQSSACNRVPLALFGQEHTEYSDVLRAQIRKLDLDPAFVRLHAGVKGQQLLDQYARAKLFLSGSYTECQPLVLLDAMASGTPFVARATGCISRMAGGIAVGTPAEAATAIDGLLADHTRWSELSAAGLLAASSTYSPDRNADLLLALVEATLEPQV